MSAPSSASMPPAAAAALAAATLAGRVGELERIYRHIEATRMAGLGLTHPKLQVQAVGFEPAPAGGATGVLVTPWFMNLVWLPDPAPAPVPPAAAAAPPPPADAAPGAAPGAAPDAAPDAVASPPTLRVGASRARQVGGEVIDFLGAHEEGFGPFETCSLFSPMFDFVDQPAAVATAQEVLKLLRAPAPAAAGPKAGEVTSAGIDPTAARRAFLLGRRAA